MVSETRQSGRWGRLWAAGYWLLTLTVPRSPGSLPALIGSSTGPRNPIRGSSRRCRRHCRCLAKWRSRTKGNRASLQLPPRRRLLGHAPYPELWARPTPQKQHCAGVCLSHAQFPDWLPPGQRNTQAPSRRSRPFHSNAALNISTTQALSNSFANCPPSSLRPLETHPLGLNAQAPLYPTCIRLSRYACPGGGGGRASPPEVRRPSPKSAGSAS